MAGICSPSATSVCTVAYLVSWGNRAIITIRHIPTRARDRCLCHPAVQDKLHNFPHVSKAAATRQKGLLTGSSLVQVAARAQTKPPKHHLSNAFPNYRPQQAGRGSSAGSCHGSLLSLCRRRRVVLMLGQPTWSVTDHDACLRRCICPRKQEPMTMNEYLFRATFPAVEGVLGALLLGFLFTRLEDIIGEIDAMQAIRQSPLGPVAQRATHFRTCCTPMETRGCSSSSYFFHCVQSALNSSTW